MKKYIPYLLVAIVALGVGYLAGGLVGAKRATQQAYYSNIMWLAAAKNFLTVGNQEEAKNTLSLGISGSLGVIKTVDDDFWSGMCFIIPGSYLLSEKEKAGILKSIDGPSACMIEKNKAPNNAPAPTAK